MSVTTSSDKKLLKRKLQSDQSHRVSELLKRTNVTAARLLQINMAVDHIAGRFRIRPPPEVVPKTSEMIREQEREIASLAPETKAARIHDILRSASSSDPRGGTARFVLGYYFAYEADIIQFEKAMHPTSSFMVNAPVDAQHIKILETYARKTNLRAHNPYSITSSIASCAVAYGGSFALMKFMNGYLAIKGMPFLSGTTEWQAVITLGSFLDDILNIPEKPMKLKLKELLLAVTNIALSKGLNVLVPVILGGFFSVSGIGPVIGAVIVTACITGTGQLIMPRIRKLIIMKPEEDLLEKLKGAVAEKTASEMYDEIKRDMARGKIGPAPAVPNTSYLASVHVVKYVSTHKSALFSLLVGSSVLATAMTVSVTGAFPRDIWRWVTDSMVAPALSWLFMPTLLQIISDIMSSELVARFARTTGNKLYNELTPDMRNRVDFVLKRQWMISILTWMLMQLKLAAHGAIMSSATIDNFYSLVDKVEGIDANEIAQEMGRERLQEAIDEMERDMRMSSEGIEESEFFQERATAIGAAAVGVSRFRDREAYSDLLSMSASAWEKIPGHVKARYSKYLVGVDIRLDEGGMPVCAIPTLADLQRFQATNGGMANFLANSVNSLYIMRARSTYEKIDGEIRDVLRSARQDVETAAVLVEMGLLGQGELKKIYRPFNKEAVLAANTWKNAHRERLAREEELQRVKKYSTVFKKLYEDEEFFRSRQGQKELRDALQATGMTSSMIMTDTWRLPIDAILKTLPEKVREDWAVKSASLYRKVNAEKDPKVVEGRLEDVIKVLRLAVRTKFDSRGMSMSSEIKEAFEELWKYKEIPGPYKPEDVATINSLIAKIVGPDPALQLRTDNIIPSANILMYTSVVEGYNRIASGIKAMMRIFVYDPGDPSDPLLQDLPKYDKQYGTWAGSFRTMYQKLLGPFFDRREYDLVGDLDKKIKESTEKLMGMNSWYEGPMNFKEMLMAHVKVFQRGLHKGSSAPEVIKKVVPGTAQADEAVSAAADDMATEDAVQSEQTNAEEQIINRQAAETIRAMESSIASDMGRVIAMVSSVSYSALYRLTESFKNMMSYGGDVADSMRHFMRHIPGILPIGVRNFAAKFRDVLPNSLDKTKTATPVPETVVMTKCLAAQIREKKMIKGFDGKYRPYMLMDDGSTWQEYPSECMVSGGGISVYTIAADFVQRAAYMAAMSFGSYVFSGPGFVAHSLRSYVFPKLNYGWGWAKLWSGAVNVDVPFFSLGLGWTKAFTMPAPLFTAGLAAVGVTNVPSFLSWADGSGNVMINMAREIDKEFPETDKSDNAEAVRNVGFILRFFACYQLRSGTFINRPAEVVSECDMAINTSLLDLTKLGLDSRMNMMYLAARFAQKNFFSAMDANDLFDIIANDSLFKGIPVARATAMVFGSEGLSTVHDAGRNFLEMTKKEGKWKSERWQKARSFALERLVGMNVKWQAFGDYTKSLTKPTVVPPPVGVSAVEEEGFTDVCPSRKVNLFWNIEDTVSAWGTPTPFPPPKPEDRFGVNALLESIIHFKLWMLSAHSPSHKPISVAQLSNATTSVVSEKK